LIHPGLSFLILSDGSRRSQAALDVGGHIARLAHARVTILTYGMKSAAEQRHLQEAKEKLGSGLASLELRSSSQPAEAALAHEVEHQPHDLIIIGFDAKKSSQGISLAEGILRLGEHHLLLIPTTDSEPARALVCVTGGEPGKEDVLFAGRFLRHLGAEATLLSVLPPSGNSGELHERVERFLRGGVRTLDVLKVPAQTLVRSGNVREEINNQMREGGHDLLILGAPLNRRRGEISLHGLVGQILEDNAAHPVLIVRSRYVAASVYPKH
jgi:sulfate transport system ATP-binding protein